MTDTATRNRALVIAIACVGVFGITIGLGVPLLSIQLEARGESKSIIGLVAAMPAFGTMLASLVLPRLLATRGIRVMLYTGLLIELVCFLLLPVFTSVTAWIVLRFVMGASGAILFLASETWINSVAREETRGRVLAIYSVVLGASFAAGPVTLLITGTAGVAPFVAGAMFVAVAGVVLCFGGRVSTPPIEGAASFSVMGFFLVAPTVALAILLTAWHDVSALSLLPVYGIHHGYPSADSALLVTAFCLGLVVLTWPIGWLADHANRYHVLIGCGVGTLVGAAMLPWIISNAFIAWPALFLWGGCTNGLYSVAMTIVGERFTGAELATATASFGMLWGIGSLVGPLSTGALMDVAGPQGLPLTLAVVAGLFLLVALLRQRQR